MKWLSVYLPLLPLEVFQHSEIPLAISDANSVLLCNSAAQAQGISTGLGVHTALSIHDQLLLKTRDIDRETQLLTQLAETAYQFSSQVVTCTNRRQQHSLLLEIAGSLRLFNSVEQLLESIRQALANSPLRENGFHHQLAIAATPKAAELLARCPAKENDNRACAAHIDPLLQVPVALLDCDNKIIEQCQDMGLETLGQLLELPGAAINKRFKPEFNRYLQQLRGERDDPQSHFIPPDTFSRELFYIDGLRSHQDLQQAISQLLGELCRYLQQRQLQCLDLSWEFTRFSRQKNPLHLQFSKPQQHYDTLLALTRLQLDQIPLDSPVESVALQADQFTRIEVQWQDFFSNSSDYGDPALLADKISGKLGRNAIKAVEPRNQYLPEKKNRLANRIAIKPASTKAPVSASLASTPPRPGWLLPAPRPLELRHGQPHLAGTALQLVEGPERIESNWLSQKTSRDYFIATPATPNQQSLAFYWIYYNRLEQGWFLHGLFA